MLVCAPLFRKMTLPQSNQGIRKETLNVEGGVASIIEGFIVDNRIVNCRLSSIAGVPSIGCP